MRICNSASVMILSVALAPVPILVFANVRRWLAGRGFEPFIDNAIGYLLLLVVFSAGAATTGLYHAQQHKRPGARPHVATYALAGAAGSAALMFLADLADDYFTGPGIGWVWPTFGFASGFAFGAIFRAAYGLLAPQRGHMNAK